MEYPFLYFYKLCHNRTRRWLFLVGIVAVTHLLFQSLLLPYGNALLSLLPDQDVPTNVKNDFPTVGSSTKSVMVRNPLTVNASDLIDPSVIVRLEGYADKVEAGGIGFDSGLIGNERIKEINSTLEGNGLHNTSEGYADKVEAGGIGFDSGVIGNERIKEIDSTLEGNGLHNISEHVVDGDVDNSYPTKEDGNERFKEMNFASEGKGFHNTSEQVVDKDVDNNYPTKEVIGMNGSLALVSIENKGSGSILDNADKDMEHQIVEQQIVKPILKVSLENNISLTAKKSEGDFHTSFQSSPLTSSPAALNDTTLLKTLTSGNSVSSGLASQESDMVNLGNHSATMTIPGIKKMRSEMPPKSRTSIHEMNHILLRHPRSMKPRRSSARDQEIVAVKKEIMHSPNAINDRELFAPLFRNVSMFKRSYELMERTLKVYVYRDGVKPIFHLPIMKGLYASEGWFMKLMEGNKQFVVKDPRRAHLFYMPFSSRMLEYTLYVRNSHNRTNLRLYLKDYSEKIAAKYPYWNRTDGADHFLVACHDWAPYETRHHMERCIKALCNADVTQGFKIGRDVSLPETYVRSARNPLRDLGGKPPSRRPILAFYAGSMHGYLRPILLKYWKDKDPDMKIFGPMPPGVASKMNYIHHMKTSKYCICPKGYEVNSPRIVEAIFYECVPVIISDNFVPPFFEVLNWEAFSLIIAEADIPRLKDILLSIPKEKYLELQLAVRKVQKHFLWHAKPMKYDLFHMTLHSIWYSRVLQTKLR